MKKSIIFIFIIVCIIVAGLFYRQFLVSRPAEKIYVAVEGESKIAVLDSATQKIVSTIDLSIKHEGGRLPYAPHNVQVGPDMKMVWVTANSGAHQDHVSGFFPSVYAHGGAEDQDAAPDVVIVIDPQTDRIIERIPMGYNLHLAHVVLTPDSLTALVTAQNEGTIYKINARTFVIEKKISIPSALPDGVSVEPHGLRVSPDGSAAYIAILQGKSLGILDLKTNDLEIMPLAGVAVQAGVTPDGKIVFVSLYDTKELALYLIDTKEIKKVKLPTGAKGPVQMYPTPDSRFVYLADQGYYFGQPASEWVYKIDLQKFEVVKEIKAGSGPHGIVVSPDGMRVYVTNLLSGDVSIINTAANEEIGRIKVGKEPNGISVWVNNK